MADMAGKWRICQMSDMSDKCPINDRNSRQTTIFGFKGVLDYLRHIYIILNCGQKAGKAGKKRAFHN